MRYINTYLLLLFITYSRTLCSSMYLFEVNSLFISWQRKFQSLNAIALVLPNTDFLSRKKKSFHPYMLMSPGHGMMLVSYLLLLPCPQQHNNFLCCYSASIWFGLFSNVVLEKMFHLRRTSLCPEGWQSLSSFRSEMFCKLQDLSFLGFLPNT